MRKMLAGLMAALWAGGAAACGGAGDPCGVEGGVYHALTPAGGQTPPAVIFLHGFGGRGEGIIKNRGLMAALTGRGYAVIAPQGLPFRPNSKGGAWNSFANPERRDDVAFLQEVAKDAAARFGLDRERMLIGGFSGGGMMTWRVACDAPESFAGLRPYRGASLAALARALRRAGQALSHPWLVRPRRAA